MTAMLLFRRTVTILAHITAVGDQIKQVFLNLLTNAVDACVSGNHGGIITVNTRQNNEKAVIAIKDTDLGIQPKNVEQLYLPFYATKPEAKGVGLGLSINYGIIKKHQGEVQVESTSGRDSTSTVVLPAKTPHTEAHLVP